MLLRAHPEPLNQKNEKDTCSTPHVPSAFYAEVLKLATQTVVKFHGIPLSLSCMNFFHLVAPTILVP